MITDTSDANMQPIWKRCWTFAFAVILMLSVGAISCTLGPKRPNATEIPASSYTYSPDPFNPGSIGSSGSSRLTDCFDWSKVEIVSAGFVVTSEGSQFVVTYRPDQQDYKLTIVPNDKLYAGSTHRATREAICAAEQHEAEQRQKTNAPSN